MNRINPKHFPNDNIKLKKKIGKIVTLGVLSGVIIANGQNDSSKVNIDLDNMVSDSTLEVSIDDINDSLNLIINDNAYNYLQRNGLLAKEFNK